jgi:hypothetical protein
MTRSAVPGSTIEFAGDASPDTRNCRVNTSKAVQLHDAFKGVGITLDEFEGRMYRRIGRIKQLMESGRLGPELRWK